MDGLAIWLLVVIILLIAILIAIVTIGTIRTKKVADQELTILTKLNEQRLDEALFKLEYALNHIMELKVKHVELSDYTHRMVHEVRDKLNQVNLKHESHHLQNKANFDELRTKATTILERLEELKQRG